MAATYGHVEVAKLLLKAKADIRSPSISAQKPSTALLPIHVAAQNGHLKIIKLFLEHEKILIYLVDSEDKKPIHFAAKQGHLEIIKFFLEQDKNLINEKDNNGQTPLLLAASEGHMDAVIYLLEQGAELFNANAQNSKNPFFHAAVNGHVEMAKFLAKKDPTLFKNSEPQKILVLAARYNHVEIIQYLLDEDVQPATLELNHPGNYVDPLTIAVQNGHLEVVKVLLAHSPIKNNINSLLSSALTKKHHAMATLLLEHYFGQVESAEILIDKLKGLEETFYQSALSYCKLSHKNLITQPPHG